jgi:CHAD domain-containing protein
VAARRSRDGAPLREAPRMLRRELRHARRELARDGLGDETVHRARRRIKQARATLRLMDGQLPRATRKYVEKKLRHAAQPLGALRDARVMLETFDRLLHRHSGMRGLAGVARVRQRLTRKYLATRAQFSGGECRRVRKRLRKARGALSRGGTRQGRTLRPALVRAYADSRRALAQVRREASVENLHRWRKLTKALQYQLRLGWGGGPQLARFAAQLHALGDELGEDHDLAMLRVQLGGDVKDFADAAQEGELVALIERERARLQRSALWRGGRLFGPRPRDFTKRLA